MTGPNHGTSWAYSHHKCRCDICVEKNRERHAKSKAKKKAERVVRDIGHAVAWDYSADSGGVATCNTCAWGVGVDSASEARAAASAHSRGEARE